MRPGPQEPGEKPLVLPPKATPAPSPAPAPAVSEFEKGNFLPDGLREKPASAPDAAGSIGGDSEFGTLYSKGYPRESLPQAVLVGVDIHGKVFSQPVPREMSPDDVDRCLRLMRSRRENLPEAAGARLIDMDIDDELQYMPSPKWDWGMAE